MKWELSDFGKQTLSCTLGIVIGIVLTFGTSAWIEHREQQEAERTAALMVIHNLNSLATINKNEDNHSNKSDGIETCLSVVF